MTAYCFDTDAISATIKPTPPLHLIRRLATVPAADQFTTSITIAELAYGSRRVGRAALTERVEGRADSAPVRHHRGPQVR